MSTRQAERHGAAHASPSGPAAERRRIVASKLAAPPLRPGIVDRPLLLDGLLSATHAPVILVSAPAGYGKTTLLTLWRERDQRPFAWVSLEAADNDPVALVASLVAALDPIVGLDPAIADSLKVRDPPLEEVVLPSLVDACLEGGQPVVLVLDDLHLVSERRCHTVIGYLAERLPPGCQLALGTRTDPPLPLGSWRAHGQLVELRAAELSLGESEAGALLVAAGVRLPDAQVARLVERTEGWPAGLYLAALSLRDRSQPTEFVDRFAGTSRHVADFLSEDVLARQPEEVIGFLLRTCVLEELTASLCAVLAGTSGADAEAVLRELERGNLFVVPLDEERLAWRYHHLFVQYLGAELARREPELVPELHRRAWRWYREHGLVGRAVAHAQACGDVEVAAELVAAEWSELSEGGQIETVRSWLAGFEDAQIEGHAPLAIAAAWVAALTGERERAARFAEAARRGSWAGLMPDGTASLESALAIMSSAFGLDSVSRMRSVAQRAVDLEPATSRHRAIALELLGIAHTIEGDIPRARDLLDEAVQLAGDETSTSAFSLTHLAVISLREGDEEAAFGHAQRAHAIVQQPRMRADLASVATYSVIAHLLSRRGDLAGAALAVERANALLPRLTEGFWWLMIETRILLAPVLAALGRTADAATRLEEAAALLTTHPDAGKLPDWHTETVRNLRPAARRRPPSSQLSDAERRILRLLATDLSLSEIGRELYLSTNTVKTHTRAIYRKLGVSSREEAVKAAGTEARAVRGTSPG
jgi:LuxR family transcriptional regulator, maltose regulon positive regulatory protein